MAIHPATTRRQLLGAGLAGMAAALLPRPAPAGPPSAPSPAEVFDDPIGPVLGNPRGDVTVAVYFDYQCPYCKAGHPTLTRIVARDGKVRLLMKDWPIFGPASLRASRLVLGGIPTGEYEAAQAALMATPGRLNDAAIDAALAKAGLDPKALKRGYARRRADFDGFLARNEAQATGFGFPGTPAFVIGTTIYAGVLDGPALKRAIAEARG